ncbi:hypothetical protein HZC30_03240 [Candidatus Woesearchaeota archaeon]|nr:hypothetical protein [Candidatus Woesearchaeota archaeon]
MNLEQTIKKSFGKINRLGRVRCSWAGKAAIYSLVGALSVVSYECGGGSEQDTSSDNVSISSGTTNSEGKAVFTDKNTEETVNVFVSSEEGVPIANAAAAFFDGDNFEMFYIEGSKSDYVPQLGLFPHNSDHHFKLTSINTAPWTIKDYGGEETYVKSVEEWLQQRGAYNGCWTKEEIKAKNKIYSYVLGTILGGAQVVNTLKGGQSLAGIWGIEIADYNHEFFITPKPGEGYFGDIAYYSPFTPSTEICNDLDDDCDNQIDEDGVCEKTSRTTGTSSNSECYDLYTHCYMNWADCIADCPTGSEGKECKCDCYKEGQSCCGEITCTPTGDYAVATMYCDSIKSTQNLCK